MSVPILELMAAIDKASDARSKMVDRAKATGPTAQFHIDLVNTSRAIERATKARFGRDADEVHAALKDILETQKSGE